MRLEVLFALEAFHDGPGEDEVGHLLEVISEAWVDSYAVASLGHSGYVLDVPLYCLGMAGQKVKAEF